jgi:hypothetical protein
VVAPEGEVEKATDRDHEGRYRLIGDGLRLAIFYTKLRDRLLRPFLASIHRLTWCFTECRNEESAL